MSDCPLDSQVFSCKKSTDHTLLPLLTLDCLILYSWFEYVVPSNLSIRVLYKNVILFIRFVLECHVVGVVYHLYWEV